jgi:hypothetical protein
LGLGVFYVKYVCNYKMKYLSQYIYPLSKTHNTSPTSGYFGLDNCDCEYLEY